MDLSKSKIEVFYPTESDLKDTEMLVAPQIYFHTSYFGLQIFLVKSRNEYQVKSMNFVPSFIKNLDYQYIISHTYLKLFTTTDFKSAVYMYQKCVSDLIYDQNLKHLACYDVADLSPFKYPHEINLVRKVFC